MLLLKTISMQKENLGTGKKTKPNQNKTWCHWVDFPKYAGCKSNVALKETVGSYST